MHKENRQTKLAKLVQAGGLHARSWHMPRDRQTGGNPGHFPEVRGQGCFFYVLFIVKIGPVGKTCPRARGNFRRPLQMPVDWMPVCGMRPWIGCLLMSFSPFFSLFKHLFIYSVDDTY